MRFQIFRNIARKDVLGSVQLSYYTLAENKIRVLVRYYIHLIIRYVRFGAAGGGKKKRSGQGMPAYHPRFFTQPRRDIFSIRLFFYFFIFLLLLLRSILFFHLSGSRRLRPRLCGRFRAIQFGVGRNRRSLFLFFAETKTASVLCS